MIKNYISLSNKCHHNKPISYQYTAAKS